MNTTILHTSKRVNAELCGKLFKARPEYKEGALVPNHLTGYAERTFYALILEAYDSHLDSWVNFLTDNGKIVRLRRLSFYAIFNPVVL